MFIPLRHCLPLPDSKKSKCCVRQREEGLFIRHAHDEDHPDEDEAHHQGGQLDDVDDPFPRFPACHPEEK